jgi:hypothetical protein
VRICPLHHEPGSHRWAERPRGNAHLADGLEAELDKASARVVATTAPFRPGLGLALEEVVAPQPLQQLVLVRAKARRVHARKLAQREGPAVEARAEGDRALGRIERDRPNARIPKRLDHPVELCELLDECMVQLRARQLQLQEAAVELVEHDDGHDALDERLAKHARGVRGRPLDSIDHHQRAVCHAQCRRDLGRGLDLARGADHADEEGAAVALRGKRESLSDEIVERQARRSRDRDLARLLVRPRVHQANIRVCLGRHDEASGRQERIR